MTVINLYDKTGDNRFLTVEEMLDKAKEIKDHPAGIVILVDKTGRNSIHIEGLFSNLDMPEINLVLDLLKQQMLGPANGQSL